MRRRLEESPLFAQLLEEDERASSPVRQVFATAWPQLLVGAGTALLGVGGFYLITTFVISYGTTTLGMPRWLLLTATLVAAAVEIVVLIVGGRLAERYGPARVTVAGSLGSALVAFPAFWMIDTTVAVAVVAGVTVATALLSIPYAVSGALLTELFPPQLRYSGVALSANIAGVVSGFVPLAATALLALGGGSSVLPTLLLVGISLVTCGCGWAAPRLFAGRDQVATAGAPTG